MYKHKAPRRCGKAVHLAVHIEEAGECISGVRVGKTMHLAVQIEEGWQSRARARLASAYLSGRQGQASQAQARPAELTGGRGRLACASTPRREPASSRASRAAPRRLCLGTAGSLLAAPRLRLRASGIRRSAGSSKPGCRRSRPCSESASWRRPRHPPWPGQCAKGPSS